MVVVVVVLFVDGGGREYLRARAQPSPTKLTVPGWLPPNMAESERVRLNEGLVVILH